MTPPQHSSQDQNLLLPLIEIMRALTRVISAEITLLQERRPQEIKSYLPEKNKLMAAYQKELADLSARGGLQASGSGDAIRTLKQETRLFHGVLEQHARMTKALKTVSERMLKAVSDEVVKSRSNASTYGANGAKYVNKSATSISLNQNI
ncbi:hypothetical protein [Paremcibacter congregatus]|uniref:Flagellar basal-body protein FlbY n=1 Tax=Paremcibacter congregatus TaxID=2043170 RepID=A0A2G4YLZ2_9PROT|nr:hypothetical protein [Paremcibacter congregatus]PHZ83333.1 hypothetical protein CRD36_17355 [Paremcibacter congregatus]QDE28194.1 hypothetical protein FIV45_13435 [Paremcibacter congregatus]